MQSFSPWKEDLRHGDERFAPLIEADERNQRRAQWKNAVDRARRWNV